MQSPLTNIGSKMARTEELRDFQRGPIIGCHLSNKLVCQISALLDLPGKSCYCEVDISWSNKGSAAKW